MFEQYSDDLSKIDVFPDGKTFRVSFDSVTGCLRIVARSRDALEELREAFSVKNEAAFFSKQYGFKGNERLYNVNQFGYFQPGLVYQILDWIKMQYGSLSPVAISRKCADYVRNVLTPLKGRIDPDFEMLNVADDSGANDRARERIAAGDEKALVRDMRPYQDEAVRRLMSDGWGRGMIDIPTSGGKSLIIANFIWNLLKHVDASYKTLIFVPNVQLVEQFLGDLLDYGFRREDVAALHGGMTKKQKALNDPAKAKVIVANRQYLMNNEKSLPKVDVLVCDEVHSCLAESSAALIQRSPAMIRVGCSGTIPTDKYQRNQLVGMFGRVLMKVDIKDLQDEGFISKLKITSVEMFDRQVDSDRNILFHEHSSKKYVADDPEGCDIKFDDAVRAEHDYVAKWCRELYAPVLAEVAKMDGNTLVLFDKIDIGTSLYDAFKEKYPDVKSFYNDGSTKVKEREDTRAGLEQTSGNVLFANVQILGTGVSIRRLHNLVFCFSSKSTVRIIQSCGRALRLYGDKDCANLYDVHFNYKYSSRHFKERLQLYKKHYGKPKPDAVMSFQI